MGFIEDLRRSAAGHGKHIVLPEWDDPRMYQAARIIVDENIAKVSIVGEPGEVMSTAGREGVNLDGIGIVSPTKHADFEAFAVKYAELRAKKGVTLEQAREVVADPLFCGALMVRLGKADGMVAGAMHATADVLRAAFQCIGTAPGCSIVSSCFVVIVPNCKLGEHGMMVFGDCAINPNPTASELADIAISSAQTAKALCAFEPRVAMLSFSTLGSGGDHEDVLKVREAVKLARERAPHLSVAGEMQADAALVESVGQKKAPGDSVAGRANVLIFPDLDAANIGYKLVQRLSGAEAVGPISQGLAMPVNDLSRGCSVNDIVNVAAITVLQAIGI